MADFIVLNIKSFYVEFRTAKAVQGHTFRGAVCITGIEGSALAVCPLCRPRLSRELAKLPKPPPVHVHTSRGNRILIKKFSKDA